MASLTRRFIGLGLAFSLTACALFVPTALPDESRCNFAGITNTCGQCAAKRCGQAVDACCLDQSCGGLIVDLEGCATQGREGCTTLSSAATEGDPSRRALGACVARECADACFTSSVDNATRCAPAYVTSVEACTCELSDTPNDKPCTEVGHPRLRCCAAAAWPGPALSCECLAVICTPVDDGCLCQLSAMDDNARPAECEGDTCCFDPRLNECRCGSAACLPTETRVAACTVDQLGCSGSRRRVETCTVGKP